MKQNNFVKYYVLFFATACVFILSFTQVYKQLFAPPIYHTINVKDVFDGLSANESPNFKIISANTLLLSDTMTSALKQGEIIAYESGKNSFYLKAVADDQYVQWGPIPLSEWEESSDNAMIFIFYGALALIFLLLLRPLFRDVSHLQNCAIEFGKKPTSQPLTIKPSSSVYPLAKALFDMSHQMLEQIKLHKDLAGIIAHEVRTPLARMKFVMQRIAKDIPEKHSIRLREDIHELEVLAHDYLEFGRSQITDDNYLSPFKTDDFCSSIERKYRGAPIPVQIINLIPNAEIKGNLMQIELAVTNLINNAQRFAKTEISLTLAYVNRYVNLVVEDDGPGFTAAQKSSASGNEHKGFGLGLYMVKQVALRHNGDFEISENDNAGAKMSIKFPSQVS